MAELIIPAGTELYIFGEHAATASEDITDRHDFDDMIARMTFYGKYAQSPRLTCVMLYLDNGAFLMGAL